MGTETDSKNTESTSEFLNSLTYLESPLYAIKLMNGDTILCKILLDDGKPTEFTTVMLVMAIRRAIVERPDKTVIEEIALLPWQEAVSLTALINIPNNAIVSIALATPIIFPAYKESLLRCLRVESDLLKVEAYKKTEQKIEKTGKFFVRESPEVKSPERITPEVLFNAAVAGEFNEVDGVDNSKQPNKNKKKNSYN